MWKAFTKEAHAYGKNNSVLHGNFRMADLFNDGGVIKTILRSSPESIKPRTGDEVALLYTIGGMSAEVSNRNLVYTIGADLPNLFLPRRTLDRIVCEMRHNEKCSVKVSPAYSNAAVELEIEVTSVHIRSRVSTFSNNNVAPLAPPVGDFQQHLLRNPDVMEQMMGSSFMQSLMSNPETMRSLMSANPQMQQLLEQNPELNSLMNDPDFLQQSMEAMRNPNVMREMMRNTDRAMSNIESLPGGSAALHKLYNEVQAPLFEASQNIGSSKDAKIKDARQLRLKYGEQAATPIAQPMPNPWVSVPSIPVPTVSAPSTPSGAPSAMPDLSGMAQMMQNPAMQQMMATMFRTTNAGTSTTPAVPAVSPFGNPALLQQMFSPANMQAMATLEQSLGFMQRGAGQSPALPQNGFNSMFGNFLAAQQNNPETLYRTQLATLRSMGFNDTPAAIRALQRTSGNVDRAVDLLIAEGAVPNQQ